ncbi:MAG: hypothetical protein KDH96_11810 [Candidatus Riesia sp.]|nr:hypothetical protein [Candidatus Riesia sp.]
MTEEQLYGIGCSIIIGLICLSIGLGYIFGAGWGWLFIGTVSVFIGVNYFRQTLKAKNNDI